MSDCEHRTVRCQNCEWTGTEDQADKLPDFRLRLEPGDVMPAGYCPYCGSAAMLHNEPVAVGLRLLHLTRLSRNAQLTISFEEDQMDKRNCIHFLDLNEAGNGWTTVFSCPTFESAEAWLRKYIDTWEFPEAAAQGRPLHDWTKTADLLPPPLDSVLGRWIARREHHIVIHNPDWSERDEDCAGRTWRVFRPNDDTGEAIDAPDYWQHLTLPRAEFDSLGEGAA